MLDFNQSELIWMADVVLKYYHVFIHLHIHTHIMFPLICELHLKVWQFSRLVTFWKLTWTKFFNNFANLPIGNRANFSLPSLLAQYSLSILIFFLQSLLSHLMLFHLLLNYLSDGKYPISN